MSAMQTSPPELITHVPDFGSAQPEQAAHVADALDPRMMRAVAPHVREIVPAIQMDPDVCDVYDVGAAPVVEIDAGSSRFAVFPSVDGDQLLAVRARKVATGRDGAGQYIVDRGSMFSLSRQVVGVGRRSEQFSDDRYMSSVHFGIGLDEDGSVVIDDYGSTNGTRLRSQPAEKETTPNVTREFQRELEAGSAAITESLLEQCPELLPTQKVEHGGRTFYLSDIIDPDSSYPQAILYSQALVDGVVKMVPRLLYKSNSDGGWRVTYGKEGTRYSKEALENEAHYTQETKLERPILAALDGDGIINDTNGHIGSTINSLFNLNNPLAQEVNTGSAEVSYFHDTSVEAALAPLRTVSAGMLGETFKNRLAATGRDTVTDYFYDLDQVFRQIPGFLPDFSANPVSRVTVEHTLLGTVTVEDFPAMIAGRPIIWSMARDSEGRTWVENVTLADAPTTSYGTRAEVLDMGIVTSKPLDYIHQTDLLRDGERVPFSGDVYNRYADISPVLGNLLPVAAYDHARPRSESKRTG